MINIKFWEGYMTNLDALCQILNVPESLSKTEKEKLCISIGYEKWGDQLPIHMKGYFAFLLHDEKENVYFGARDRFGVIPFYYLIKDDRIICDCYIKKVLEESESEILFNENALQLYLTFSFLPGEQTFYKNVMKLMPGQRFVYKKGIIKTSKYYDYSCATMNINPEKYEEVIEKNIEEYVNKMEETDCAFLLSSGIDSNYIYSISDSNNAYTIGYSESEFDESRTAELNAKMYGKTCQRLIISAEDFFESVEEASVKMEQPIGTASSVAFMIGCKEIGKQTNVCLTGEGADELFAGYEIYKKADLFTEKICYLGKTHIFEESEKKSLLKRYTNGLEDCTIVKKLCPRNQCDDNLQNMLTVDINFWLEADSFVNSFKMSRSSNLEIRMPFVNEELFEIARYIPSNLKIFNDIDKYILRKITKERLPREIAWRKKRGFVLPIRQWMVEPKFLFEIDAVLKSETINKFFNINVVNEYLNEFICGNQKLWRKIWCLYAFAKWYDCNFKKEDYTYE